MNTQWLAAMTIAVTIFSSMSWIFNFLVHAGTASIASRKDDKDELHRQVATLLLFTCALAIVSVSGLILFKNQLYNLFNVSPELLPLVEDYYKGRLWGFPLYLFSLAVLGILRGLEQVDFTLKMAVISTSTNILLTMIFVYQLDWGLWGAALATSLSFGAQILLTLPPLFKEIQLSKLFSPKKLSHNLLSFGKNSINMLMRTASLTSCFLMATLVVTRQGEIATASYQILLELWLISSFFIDGLAITATIKIASLLAQNKQNQIHAFSKKLFKISFVLGLALTIIYVSAKTFIVSIFTTDQAVMTKLNDVWLIIALFQPMNALAFILDGIFFGSEDFKFLRNMMVSNLLFVGIPLFYLAHNNQSFTLIWWAMIAVNAYRVLLGFIHYKSRFTLAR